jgi:hypothetical protein
MVETSWNEVAVVYSMAKRFLEIKKKVYSNVGGAH